MTIKPATWEWDEVPRSLDFDDIYHSQSGALEQAEAVFLAGNNLPARWHDCSSFVICETGFGLGINFLTTWCAWKHAGSPCRLHYIAVERYPLTKMDLREILSRYPSLATEANLLLEQWVLPISGMHRLVFESEKLILTLLFGDASTMLKECMAGVDAFYLDGFSPAKNPEMWNVQLFKRCARLAVKGSTLATYTVAGHVRKALTEAGFVVHKVEGFGSKRHRLMGTYQGFGRAYAVSPVIPQKVAVIGAGIAGCSLVERLVARGIEVHLFDRHAAPAQQTSGNRAGVLFPLVSADESIASRISRAAFLWWQRQRDTWKSHGLIAEFNGVLQLARSEKQAQQQASAIERLQLPSDYIQFLTQKEASRMAGYSLSQAGWFFPQAGWVNPESLCYAMLRKAPHLTICHWNTPVTSISSVEAGGWKIHSHSESILVDHVVLANAWESESLFPSGALNFRKIRGQTSQLSQEVLPELKVVISQDGYVTPPSAGFGCMGATYEWEDQVAISASEARLQNAERVQKMFQHDCYEHLYHDDSMEAKNRMGWRTSTLDRLPWVGSLQPFWGEWREGLWGLLGLGSRGLMWSPWLAELLASALCKEPIPLEAKLWSALDPYRKR